MPAVFEPHVGASGICAVIAVMAMTASVLVFKADRGLDSGMSPTGEGSRAAVGWISVAAKSAMASIVG